MKTLPIALAAHNEQRVTAWAWAMKIMRADGEVYGFTSAQRKAVISGTTYSARPGLDVTSWSSSAGGAVDNNTLTVLADDSIFTQNDVLAGRWNAARYEIFRYNFLSPSDGIVPARRGWLAVEEMPEGAFTIELRGLKQKLQQPFTKVTTKTCRANFGDDACGVDLTPYTFDFEVTSVDSEYPQQVITDAALAGERLEDDFANGVLTWTLGENIGLKEKIKLSAVDGTLTLDLPMWLPIALGDTATIVIGCRKRRLEDCFTRFNNVRRMQAEPDLVTLDDLTQYIEPNV